MTVLIYLLGISVTVSWSVWAYQTAPEPHKTLGLFVPAAVLTGFIVLSFHSILDVPLVLLYCIILGLGRWLHAHVRRHNYRKGPSVLFGTVYALSAALVFSGFALRDSPYVLIFVGRIQRLALSPENLFAWATQGSLSSRVNQLFIAMVSYIPVAVFRMAVARIQRMELQREIDMLREEMKELREMLPKDPLDDSRL